MARAKRVPRDSEARTKRDHGATLSTPITILLDGDVAVVYHTYISHLALIQIPRYGTLLKPPRARM
jgi:hypothetical protein